MKTKILITVTLLISTMASFGQRPAIELTFTAIDSAAYVQPDSIKVMNHTQIRDTILYYPDTVLMLYYHQVGVPETNFANTGFRVLQNYPNPVAEKTTVSLHVPEKDVVSIAVTDIMGRVVVRENRVLDKGQHSFMLDPGSGNILFFNASWQGQHSSIKILPTNSLSGHTARLEYIGYETSSPQLKACKDVQSFQFSLGDELLYIGYHDSLQSGMTDIPENNDTLTFQFATNIPCPGTPTVEYEGQLYNTIQIFSQCWLKENLNVGTMIPGSQYMSDNGILEKYCYNNEPDSCTKYGGLYQWNEMMQYTDQAGTQGICPPGWHLPTDEDWKVLEGAVDSQYGIGDAQWNIMDYRGYDVAKNLKTTSGWSYNGNGTDLFGFSGLPGGSYFFNTGSFSSASSNGVWWTSKGGVSGRAYRRHFFCIFPEANREYHFKNYGYSVRCINDKQ